MTSSDNTAQITNHECKQAEAYELEYKNTPVHRHHL